MKTIAGTVMLLAMAAWGFTQEPKPQEEPTSFGADLKDVDLHNLTLAVQKITKKTFLWLEDPQINLRQKRVHFVSDLSVVDDPEMLFQVYQSILQVSGLMLYKAGKEGEEIYKIGLAAGVGPKMPVDTVAEGMVPEDRFVTRLFSLNHASPRDVHAVLQQMSLVAGGVFSVESAGVVVATDYDYNIRRFETIIKAMDVKKPDVELKLVALKYAYAKDVQQMMADLVQTLVQRVGVSSTRRPPGASASRGIPGQEPVQVVADERTNSLILLAEPMRLVQLEDIVKRLDSETPFETSGVFIYHLRHRNAEEIANALRNMYTGGYGTYGRSGTGTSRTSGVRPGQAVRPPGSSSTQSTPGSRYGAMDESAPTIIADQATNSVIFVTERDTYRTLEEVTRKLDVRRPQVLIKATVVEISADDRFDLGVELARFTDPSTREKAVLVGQTGVGISTLQVDPATNEISILPDVTTPGLLLAVMKDRVGNIPALLKAFRGRAKVNILDEPEAATTDNTQTTITVRDQVPYLNSSVSGVGGFLSTSVEYAEAATTLTISPHISEGGYLRLNTTVSISKFKGQALDPRLPPPIATREIEVGEIMIPSGGTMVIGGIVTRDETTSITGVPFLSDIPLLGWIFRRQQDREEKRTLYIFITPYILYDHNFSDYRALTKERKDQIEEIRNEKFPQLNVEPREEKLPESSFRFSSPREARREE